jgi:hypothetical protein
MTPSATPAARQSGRSSRRPLRVAVALLLPALVLSGVDGCAMPDPDVHPRAMPTMTAGTARGRGEPPSRDLAPTAPTASTAPAAHPMAGTRQPPPLVQQLPQLAQEPPPLPQSHTAARVNTPALRAAKAHEVEAAPSPAAEPPAKPPVVNRPAAPVAEGGPEEPLFRVVNTRQVSLDFEVRDVGPSGVAGVEVWHTRDGRVWNKGNATQRPTGCLIEVDGEGMHGFTLVARSGVGMGKEPPRPGDAPQVWVVVDLTPPELELVEVVAASNSGARNVTIRWTANDRNLSARPITLYYTEKENGPWTPLATQLENTGRYVWTVPGDAMQRVLVRAEASDLAGNVATSQTQRPVLLDASCPAVVIKSAGAAGAR